MLRGMRSGVALGIALVLAASGCDCGASREGALRVVVRFERFPPGCLEVTASEAAPDGRTDSIQLAGEGLSGGKAVIAVGPMTGWSRDWNVGVRSFEHGCDGPVLEQFAREPSYAVQPGLVGEWLVELTAVDADGDGYAAAAEGVNGTDCDDTATVRHPGAPETCGEVDMNCDGLSGCFDPVCIGRACDDGLAETTLDVCRADGGCHGAPFTDCDAGSFVSAAGTAIADRACAPCASGAFSAATNATGCTPWTDCDAGSYVSVAATATADRACAVCADGFYSSLPNSAVCAAVGTCAPGTTQQAPATLTTPVLCAPCDAGTFCAGGTAEPLPCDAGTWDDDLAAASPCAAWADCPPGLAVDAPGSAVANRTCAPCDAGTFSPAANAAACDAWRECAVDTYEVAAPTATLDRQCAGYTSCLDLLTRAPGTPSGLHAIDPDGADAGAPFTVKCDMSAADGGWTVISFEDFQAAATGWSDARRDTTSNCATTYSAMLGGYNLFGSGATSSKTYDLLGVPHTELRVSLDYYVIDSWDNERAQVSVGGTLVYDVAFPFGGGTNLCGAGWNDYGLRAVVATLPHTANSVVVTVTSNLNEGAGNESFGVDNVLLMVR